MTGGRPRSRWRARWHRLVIPFTVLGLLVGVTLLARAAETPDLRDPQTLAPTGTGPDGGSALAALLADRGVSIEEVHTFSEGRRALRTDGDAVLFLPKPTLFGGFLAYLASQQAGHRVVLVAPGQLELATTGLPVSSGPKRWAARAGEPGCALREAAAAGVATAEHHRYLVEDPADRCYGGGLVRVASTPAEVFVVGATDPFRNQRIDEHANAALALALLATSDRVIWAGALPTEVDFALPPLSAPRRGELDRSGGSAFASLVAGYPPGVLAGLTLFVVLLVLVALASGRRPGGPVPEPLPVTVPAAESVIGRGRLYQRAGGRSVALAALRAAALPRLIRALGRPRVPAPPASEIVAGVAHRTGLPTEQVHHILYGPAPQTDQELSQAVAALDWLVAAATRDLPAERSSRD